VVVIDDDSGSFEDFVASRWSRLVRSAVLMGADLQSAEDLTQTVLANCHRRWGKVSSTRDPDAYVHRMLINALNDSRRRRWWGEHPTRELPETTVDGVEDTVSSRDLLRSALLRLPLGQRQAVVSGFGRISLSSRQRTC
jgi:DNA-directed RNA polymerase specialized sigma24 family protein